MATKKDFVKMLEAFGDDDEVNFKVDMKPEYTISMVVPEKAEPVNTDTAPTEVVEAQVVEETVADEVSE